MSCLGIPIVYVQPTGLNAVSWLCNRNIKMFKAHLEEKNKAHVSYIKVKAHNITTKMG